MWEGETKPTEKAQFGRTAESYAKHRLGFPASMYARLAVEGLLKAGMAHIDVGTGTGALALSASMMGLKSVGLDIDRNMLAAARTLANNSGLRTSYRQASAEETGCEDASQDLVTAGQCWHWFDRPKAAAEALRILKPGGHLVMCHYDWMAYGGNMVEATEDLITEHAPNWKAKRGNGLYPLWLRDLAEAGFVGITSFSYDEPAIYSHEAWVYRIEASAGIAALDLTEREAFKAALIALLARDFPATPLHTPHRVFCCWGMKSTQS
jgi:SAM-dependent methyltransferase